MELRKIAKRKWIIVGNLFSTHVHSQRNLSNMFCWMLRIKMRLLQLFSIKMSKKQITFVLHFVTSNSYEQNKENCIEFQSHIFSAKTGCWHWKTWNVRWRWRQLQWPLATSQHHCFLLLFSVCDTHSGIKWHSVLSVFCLLAFSRFFGN